MPRRRDKQPIDLSKAKRLDSGALRLEAYIGRTGVQTYRDAETGRPRREYRPPAEVFAPRVLDALRGAPLTLGHPSARHDGSVRAETFSELSIGHVGEDVRADGKFLASTVQVSAARGIERVESGETELSMGYDLDLEMVSGVSPEGEPYDAIQRNIRPNHVALVPKGRAGAEVALRLDANDNETDEEQPPMKIKIAGVEYEAGSPEAIAAQTALEKRLDAADAETKRLRGAQSRALRETAKRIGIESRADADDQSVMTDAIKKIAPDVDVSNASPEFLAGAFAVAVSFALKAMGAAEKPKPPENADPAKPPSADGAAGVRADAVDAHRRTDAASDNTPTETAEERRQRLEADRVNRAFAGLR